MSRTELILGWIILSLAKMTRRRSEELPKLFCLAGDHVGDRIFVYGLYERDILDGLFLEIFAATKENFSDGICLDIGANIGNHTLFFSKLFKKTISFEPNPVLCSIIRANLELNGVDNVELFDCGLSDSDTYLDYVFDKNALGSSYFSDGGQTRGSMKLQVRRGDEVINANESTPISLIKIDVEGHEISALNGLQSTINRHHPIILYESHPEKNYEEAERLQSLIKSHGYSYFYSFESPPNPYNWPVAKAGYRLLKGSRRRLQPIQGALEAKEYLLIIASYDPLISKTR